MLASNSLNASGNSSRLLITLSALNPLFHPRDITICREIGLPSIGVLNRWNRGLRADKVINNLEELPKALRELETGIN